MPITASSSIRHSMKKQTYRCPLRPLPLPRLLDSFQTRQKPQSRDGPKKRRINSLTRKKKQCRENIAVDSNTKKEKPRKDRHWNGQEQQVECPVIICDYDDVWELRRSETMVANMRSTDLGKLSPTAPEESQRQLQPSCFLFCFFGGFLDRVNRRTRNKPRETIE